MEILVHFRTTLNTKHTLFNYKFKKMKTKEKKPKTEQTPVKYKTVREASDAKVREMKKFLEKVDMKQIAEL